MFPNESIGRSALNALLHGGKYQALTIDEVIEKYAPPIENDTARYQAFIRKALGVPGSTLLSDLTAAQMRALQDNIVRFEGWMVGTITRTEAPAE